ncbi:MAG TPA: hypothetical protein VGI75_05360 [Pirellulales bacterium]
MGTAYLDAVFLGAATVAPAYLAAAQWIGAGVILLTAAIAGALAVRRQWANARRRQLAEAKLQFHRLREQLEAKFLQTAGLTGRPRGLRWADCEFEHEVAYARDRRSGRLSAFVAVSIKFEAIPGGGMEEVEAVNNAKYGTAVFHYDAKQRWIPEGQPIFNLHPSEAVVRYDRSLELVAATDD